MVGTVGTALLGVALLQTNADGAALRFRLDAQPSYPTGRPVEIRFTLENLSSDTLFVLTWYTPLEGLKGEVLEVLRDGKPVPYEGRMVKRGSPRAQDYVRIQRRRSKSATVDLATAYDMGARGEYQVKFIGRVHDVVSDPAALPRAQNDHRGVDVPGNTVRFSVR
jgi:hypothetical protein